MGEIAFTKKCTKIMEMQGCIIYPLIGQMRGSNGWPDRLVVTRHGLFLIEFKGFNTPLQLRQMLIMQKVNFVHASTCFIIRQGCGDTGIHGLYSPELYKGKQLLLENFELGGVDFAEMFYKHACKN